MNSFIVNTVDFINKFGALAERKLAKVSHAVQRVEIMLTLLEGKLDSVPWLVDGEEPPAIVQEKQEQQQQQQQSEQGDESQSTDAAAAPVAAAPVADVITVREDSRYSKYFAMMDKGVVKQALAARLTMEGLDPALLDTPDAPAPEGAMRVGSESSDDESSAESEEEFD